MQVQYLTDKKGHRKSVVIPYGEWEKLLKEMEKQRVLLGLKSAISDVREMTSGKKSMKTMEKLLDEL
jgi:hypothetical protein